MRVYVTYGPTWEEALAVDDVIELPVQVNGKVRRRVQLARNASKAGARAAALAADGFAARLAGQAVRKFVYLPGQVVNLVECMWALTATA